MDRDPTRPRHCLQCAKAFRPQALPVPPYQLQPYDMRALDPEARFCSILCAARFGVAASIASHPWRT